MQKLTKINFTSESNPEADIKLWNAFKNGDEEALESIFKRNYTFLFDYGIRIAREEELVKDCIQDIFAYLWEKREKIGEVHSIRTYLLISLRRKLIKTIKAQRKKENILKYFVQEMLFQDSTFEDMLISEEEITYEKNKIESALNKIPDRTREALYLRIYQDLSYKEIGKIMSLRPQVARNYVYDAFKRLKNILTTRPSL